MLQTQKQAQTEFLNTYARKISSLPRGYNEADEGLLHEPELSTF
jgi:hypothetical protein